MEAQISLLVHDFYEVGDCREEKLIHRINYLFCGESTLEIMKEVHELINALEEEIGDEYETNLAIMRDCVNVEEERLRVVEEERLDRLRVRDVKRLLTPVLLDRLWEPGLVARILEDV